MASTTIVRHVMSVATLAVLMQGMPGALAQDPKTHPDFTGQWTLNRELSTDPRQVQEGRRDGSSGDPGRRGGGGLPGGFGGGGRGDAPGGFGGGRGAGDGAQMRERMQEAQRLLDDAPSSMVVVYADPKLTITATDGRTRTMYTDKRKQKTSNGNADAQARWDGNRVVVETKFGSIKVVETYALAADSRQLVVTSKVDAPEMGRGGRPTTELKRVYDRVTDSAVPN